jgi:tetratricopeptide (TPR) repeat protein
MIIACKYKVQTAAKSGRKIMDRIEKLKAFLAQNPADSFVQHALALEYIKLGRDEEAKELFQTILARDEKYIGSYYHLAKLLERIGETDEAIACYEKGMKMAKEVRDNHAYNELQAAYEEASP